MGFKVYGIGSVQVPDNVGETIVLDGLDTSHLKLIYDEHSDKNLFNIVGRISYFKKIHDQSECENPKQLRCWKFAGAPFLYAEGELADDQEHPNAQAAAALIKFTSRPDIQDNLRIGFSVDGGIMERMTSGGQPTEDKEQGKIISQSMVTGLSLTVKPCNPKCVLWPENDLAKSDLSMAPPKGYFEALKKSQAISSFNENLSKDLQLYLKLGKLKKSLGDYFAAFTDLKCFKCGKSHRFFKSSSNIPNSCDKCGNQFTMSAIWKSLNK